MTSMISLLKRRSTAKIAVLAAVLLISFATAQPAHAGVILGEVAFMGTFQATGGSSGTDLLNATGIDFAPFGIVAASTGDFAANGVGLLTPVAMTDFIFSPFNGPVNALWTVGAFSFTLDSLSSVTQSVGSLALQGTGVVTSTIAGLTPTAFSWSFSGDNSGGTLQLFSSSATSLPEDSATFSTILTLAMGMGFGALCLRPRGRRQETA